jgi:uncharacterized protein with PIN domain
MDPTRSPIAQARMRRAIEQIATGEIKFEERCPNCMGQSFYTDERTVTVARPSITEDDEQRIMTCFRCGRTQTRGQLRADRQTRMTAYICARAEISLVDWRKQNESNGNGDSG